MRLLLPLLLLLCSCLPLTVKVDDSGGFLFPAPPPGGDTDTDTDADTDADTDTDTDTLSLTLHHETGVCIHGAQVDVDMGTIDPVMYQVHIRYTSGVSEMLIPDVDNRPSILIDDIAKEGYESPTFREMQFIHFRCGYRWEINGASGPFIDGDPRGLSVQWDLFWLTLE